MTTLAAAPRRGRVPIGSALALAGYLVFCPPIFLLGPLVGLLLIARPSSTREWWWLLAAGGWLLLTVVAPGGISLQSLQAAGVLASGAFIVAMLRQPRSFTAGALFAAAAAVVLATILVWGLGLNWQDIQLAVAHDGWELCRQQLATLEERFGPSRAAGLRPYVDAMAGGVGAVAALYPGMLVLTALPGLLLAWNWFHRIATHPFGRPAGRFTSFRFSDQLVWVLVVAIALLVLPVPERAADFGANLALVAGTLYVLRGAAVAWTLLEKQPNGILLLFGLGLLFLLPVALGALLSLGLADTWLDLRRRFASLSSRA